MNAASSIAHVVIIGAGPYGLSLAAHLRETNVGFRIFGRPMQSWATQMPVGMKLKSDGFASNLSAGSVRFTLEDFCRLTHRPYHGTDLPVAVEDFVAYGLEFQRRFVASLDPRNVASVERRSQSGRDPLFHVTLEDGDSLMARHVVVATGVSLFQYIPENLAHLPADLVTHSTLHQTFDQFKDQFVTVLGRGASSLNAAALLRECGAHVTLLTRRPRIHVHRLATDRTRSLWQKLTHPSSPLGPSLRSWLACAAPDAFHALPYTLRRVFTYKHLGPAGGVALQGRVEGKVNILAGWTIDSAELLPREVGTDGAIIAPRIRLMLANACGQTRTHVTSHIVAGTGFRYDLSRLPFFGPSLLGELRVQPTGAPVLTRNFESTARGIYFVGPAASTSFGPLLRFAAGSGYAARRVTQYLLRSLARFPAGTQRLPGPIARNPGSAIFERAPQISEPAQPTAH